MFYTWWKVLVLKTVLFRTKCVKSFIHKIVTMSEAFGHVRTTSLNTMESNIVMMSGLFWWFRTKHWLLRNSTKWTLMDTKKEKKGCFRSDGWGQRVLMGELKVQNVTQCHALKRQNLTNLTRTSCACVRGGKNEVKITCTHAPGEMIKQYSFIDTNRTQSDTLNNRKTIVAG